MTLVYDRETNPKVLNDRLIFKTKLFFILGLLYGLKYDQIAMYSNKNIFIAHILYMQDLLYADYFKILRFDQHF